MSIAERYDRRRDVDRVGIIGVTSLEALTASVVRRESARLRLARDAAAGTIPGEAPKRPTSKRSRPRREVGARTA